MGLDMYLYKRTYVKKWEHISEDKQFNVTVTRGGNAYPIDPERVCYVTEQVGYWRKFNALHDWFVHKCQEGVDNCREYYVSDDELMELLETLNKVVASRGMPVEVLEELLPTATGFFFGGTEYDDYYFQQVEYTIDLIGKLLKEEGGDYYYQSSW